MDGDPWTRPRLLKALAVAYDWLHADLTGDERKKIAARRSYLSGKMRQEYRHSDYNNHVYLQQGPILYAGLALAGDGLDDAFAQGAVAEAEGLLKEHFLPAVNQAGGRAGGRGDGGWHETMSYFSFFAYELAHELEAWRTATGEDPFPGLPTTPKLLASRINPPPRLGRRPLDNIDNAARLVLGQVAACSREDHAVNTRWISQALRRTPFRPFWRANGATEAGAAKGRRKRT